MGLGSNKPWNGFDCLTILEKAITELGKILSNLKNASLYETEPIPRIAHNNFFNTAVSGFYAGSPHGLLTQIQSIEKQFGRDRPNEIRWGERSLDIDILLFGDLVLYDPHLEIPHPRLKERRFALEPLLELWPEACEPGTRVSYKEICDNLPDQGIKKIERSFR